MCLPRKPCLNTILTTKQTQKSKNRKKDKTKIWGKKTHTHPPYNNNPPSTVQDPQSKTKSPPSNHAKSSPRSPPRAIPTPLAFSGCPRFHSRLSNTLDA